MDLNSSKIVKAKNLLVFEILRSYARVAPRHRLQKVNRKGSHMKQFGPSACLHMCVCVDLLCQ